LGRKKFDSKIQENSGIYANLGCEARRRAAAARREHAITRLPRREKLTLIERRLA